SQGASGSSADPCRAVVPPGISVSRTASRLARMVTLAPALRISGGATSLAHRSAPRPNPEPHPSFRTGARAGGGAARQRPPSARAFSPYTGLGRPLRGIDPGSQLDGFGARQRYLDASHMGEARETRRSPLGGDLYGGRPEPPRQPGGAPQ